YRRPPSPGDASTPLAKALIVPQLPEMEGFARRFACAVTTTYGSTEANVPVKAHFDLPNARVCGRARDELYELRIVDEHDADVADGTPGEIITRTKIPHAYMLGYFKEPEKTADAMRGGWFHTGDLGLRRPDGYYVFLDRLKDTIRRRGENISSFVVEKVVADHPAVQQCAVFGVPSELSEEDVKVIAVLRNGVSCEPAAIVEWCAGRMADFMVPRYVEFRPSLPLTDTGRVHKFKLRHEGIGDAWDRLAPGWVGVSPEMHHAMRSGA
ncbi:MAG: AMP-binding enzyme, partial [Acidimicrobiales bacterium]